MACTACARSASRPSKSASPAAAAKAPSGGKSAPTSSAAASSPSPNPKAPPLGSAIQALAAAETGKSIADWSNALVQLNEADTKVPTAPALFDYFGAMEKQISLTSALSGRGFL